MTDLAIVIVTWNVRELLQHCLHSIEASLAGSGIAYTIIVVDNASSDGTPALLRAAFPRVCLIEPGVNLGFAGGNNLALRRLLADNTPYILLLNPDTEVVGDAIPRLLAWLAARPDLVAVGPQLRYGDGSTQPSRRRFPTRASLLWESTVLERRWPANPWAQHYRCADIPDDVAQPVDWLVGAALLVRTAAIRRAGLLDERFFLYSEELEWEYRLQQAQHTATNRAPPPPRSAIWYLPDAVVIHHEGKSSEQVLARRQISFNRSKLLLARMWYGWRFARLLRALLRLSFAYELAVEAAKLLLGHRRALRRQRITVYWQVLREL